MKLSYVKEKGFPYSAMSAENMRFDREGEMMFRSSDLRIAVKNFEMEFILRALDRNLWHRGKTATELGIGDKTLYRKIKQYHLSP
ncbi:helix-turn-helix domain-containing protein [Desulfobacterales bacterium HSG2]|nr:helix-turn-helix domain-containing protein [Desulfobacterales bacterium HSG2]MDM8548550.1 helix-turn-helix domain-containing protein [Desulfobacterales bacterium HSG2]